MSKTPQASKILELLQQGGWHCTSEFYSMFMADPRSRISSLKRLGYDLEGRKCELHSHHQGHSKMWRIVPKQNVLFSFETKKLVEW